MRNIRPTFMDLFFDGLAACVESALASPQSRVRGFGIASWLVSGLMRDATHSLVTLIQQ
jgi:hypothetical protein